MNSNFNNECKILNSKDEIASLLRDMADIPFLSILKDNKFIELYSEKLHKNAYVIADYVNGQPMAFIAFYANDTISHKAFAPIAGIKNRDNLSKISSILRIAYCAYEIFLSKNVEFVQLEVADENIHAIDLYYQIGFQPIGQRGITGEIMEISMDKIKIYAEKARRLYENISN